MRQREERAILRTRPDHVATKEVSAGTVTNLKPNYFLIKFNQENQRLLKYFVEFRWNPSRTSLR